MSGYPFNHGDQNQTFNGDNSFQGFDAFSSFMYPAVPAPTQAEFGLTAWNNAWNGMASNNTLGYNEDDDLYEADGNQSSHAPNMTVDSNERSKRSLLASEVPQSPLLRTAMTLPRGSTNATTIPLQSNDPSLPISKSTNSASVANQPTTDRAKELREKLLASKRAGSTTPLPPTPSKTNGTAIASHVNKENRPDTVESAIQNLKNGQLHTQSSTTQANTVQPKNKSPPRSPNAPKMRLASADIEGLIDEYRAPDQVRGPETLQSVITKEVPPRPASAVERATAATGSKLSGAVRRTILTDELSKPQSGSPRSSESGEIRSDQDPGHNLTRNHQTPSATQAAKTESQHGPSVTGVLMKPNPPLGSQSKKDRTNASKSKSKPSAAGPSVRSQDPDRRQSVQPRNEPVPQRIDHSRKVTDHSPSVQVSSVSDVQPSPYRSGCDERFPRKSSVSSTPARPARSQPFPEVDTEVGKSVPGDGAKGMEEGAALSKQQSTKTHRLSSQSQAVSAARGSPPRTDAQVPGSLKPANTTMPSETNVPASQRHASLTVPSAALASQDATDAILSLSQHEQIHRLGLDLSPEGLRDLSDFLEYHGFFVKEYRDGFLARKRRLRWLEQEKLALERESLMQYERFNSIRAQTLAAREQTEPPALAGLQSKEEPGEAAAAKRMPPPLSVQRSTNNRVSATMNEGNNTLEVTPTKAITTRTSPIRTNEYLTSRSALNGSNHKRQHSDDDRDQDRGRKFTRVDSNLQYHNSSQPVSPRTARFGSQLLDGRRPLVYRAADYGYRGPSQSPDSRRRSPSPQRRAPDQFYQSQPNSWTVPYSRGPDRPRPGVEEFRRDSKATFDDRGSRDRSTYPSRSTRGISTADNRGGSRGGRAGKQLWRDYTDYQSSPARQGTVVPNGSEFLNLKAGDSRYFMIKSWNAENVEAAQRDNIWATQPKNLGALTEAFNTCRNVILVFSVNNSRAFQGYARMQSLPSSEIPAPEWQKQLLWSSTDPFRIEWITIAETRFHGVGHLKNTFNEGQAVLVGRDGQEIEAGCGRGLCEVIDQTAREQERYEPGY